MCVKERSQEPNVSLDNIMDGEFSFEEIRNNGLLYVDKTEAVYRMVKRARSRFIFCSRPRRFGKSLMCSTLACLFRGRRDLFEGLYISGTDYDFQEYTVIHLDFSNLNTVNYKRFRSSFQKALIRIMENYGIDLEKDEPSEMLNDIFHKVKGQVVLIIDEYDTPLTRLAGNERKIEFAESVRDCLSSFFSAVKSNSGRLRFLFITGILRLSNMSIFSEMNNLKDITMDEDYATAFGYTQEELEEYFSWYIDRFMAIKDLPYRDRKDFLDAVKDYYDGYCFAYSGGRYIADSVGEVDRPYRFHDNTTSPSYKRENRIPTVYNPVAVARFFSSSCEFAPFWGMTDRSGLAVKLAEKHNLMKLGVDNVRVPMSTFTNFKIEEILGQDVVEQNKLYALLYYTGYLTIEDGDSNYLRLRFPNQETAITFSRSLCERYILNNDVSYSLAMDIVGAVAEGDTNAIVETLKAAFRFMPYDYLKDADEAQYKANLHIALKVSGISDLRAEEHGPIGRADNVLVHGRHIYCIEVKADLTSKAALKQAMEHGYHLVHSYDAAKSGRTVHVVGLSFSKSERNIDSYSEVIALSATQFRIVTGERAGEVVEHTPVAKD